jgi:hypothetical protein
MTFLIFNILLKFNLIIFIINYYSINLTVIIKNLFLIFQDLNLKLLFYFDLFIIFKFIIL